MGLLSPSQVAGMRATLNRTFADECVIYRKTTTNVGGEEVDEWTVLATASCRIASIGGGETGLVAGRIAEETTHVVTLAANTDIEEPDVVVVDEIAYDVTAIRKRGAYELSRRVEAKERIDGTPEVGS